MSWHYKLVTLVVFLGMWFAATSWGLIKPIFLPPLPDVVFSLTEVIFSLDGLKDILLTLRRMVIGFVVAVMLAVPLGITLGVFRKVYESFSWMIDFFRSVPATALFPLFLIFFGFGDASKIAMGAWAAGFVILVNTIHGVWSAKHNRKVMAQTKNATAFQTLSKITFFEALPFIFAGMRIGVSWNLIVVIVAEMFIGTRFGLGHLIYDASVILDTSLVVAGIIIVGLIGYLANNLIVRLEQRVVHWGGE